MEILAAAQRLRRSVAQRGLRNVLRNVMRRVRTGNFAPPSDDAVIKDVPHPFDASAGLDTGGFIPGARLTTGHEHDLYTVAYYGTSPSIFAAAMEERQRAAGTPAVAETTFIDFGSGKGRAILMASELPFHHCTGVELHPELHAIALANLARWQAAGRNRAPLSAQCGDVTKFVFPPTPCLLYLFNPFAAKVLKEVLDHVAAEFAARPGQCDVLYINAEFNAVLHEQPGFTLLWEKLLHMSPEDAAADEAAHGEHYGIPGAYFCSAWRFTGK